VKLPEVALNNRRWILSIEIPHSALLHFTAQEGLAMRHGSGYRVSQPGFSGAASGTQQSQARKRQNSIYQPLDFGV